MKFYEVAKVIVQFQHFVETLSSKFKTSDVVFRNLISGKVSLVGLVVKPLRSVDVDLRLIAQKHPIEQGPTVKLYRLHLKPDHEDQSLHEFTPYRPVKGSGCDRSRTRTIKSDQCLKTSFLRSFFR